MSLAAFLGEMERALASATFRRLTLARPLAGEARRNLYLRPVAIGGITLILVVHRHATRDETENLSADAARALVSTLLGENFGDAHLETSDLALSLRFGRKGTPHLSRKTITAPADSVLLGHDRRKQRLLDPATLPWLRDLGLADATGQILPSRSAKWRQVERFIELLDHAWRDLSWETSRPLEVYDMGCGKGYLTFAVEAWLTDFLAIEARVHGVEQRPELVSLGNRLAEKHQRRRLDFIEGEIGQISETCDILLALHACDTATDDALALGIRKGAAMIVCAPCCQHELRANLEGSPAVAGLLAHGLLRQRQAALVTDALRTLLLEREGYRVRVVEFVSAEHTDKNLLLIATRTGKKPASNLQEIADLKTLFGIETFHLETLLT